MSKPIVMERGIKYRDTDRMALVPVKNVATKREALLHRPEWTKIRFPTDSTRIQGIEAAIRKDGLHSICKEAFCPNLAECFNHDATAFIILGAICTRRCPFCGVTHGRPVAPDANKPVKLAQTTADVALRYVVITSVDRDGLRNGGAQRFADYITAVREKSPQIKIETLVLDFRSHMDHALNILAATPPDVFDRNLENIPCIYRQVRLGADYGWSLKLLKRFKEAHPEIPTKSGLMVGLNETNEEITEVIRDLRRHGVTMLTLGQYLRPSRHHLPVQRYVSPGEFDKMGAEALTMGFAHAAYGPFVRSSYHANLQARGMEVK